MISSFIERYDQLRRFKHSIIDWTLLLGTVLGTIAFATDPLTVPGWTLGFVGHTVSIFILFVIFFLRRKLSLGLKAWTILVVIVFLIFSDTVVNGIATDNKYLLILVPYFSVLVFSVRHTLLISLITFSVFLYIGHLHTSGTLITPIEENVQRMTLFAAWIQTTLVLMLVAVVVAIFTLRYNTKVEEMVRELEASNLDLELAVHELSERSMELSKYAFINSHLLRAPLARILGLSDLLKSGHREDLYEELEKAGKELDSIIHTINELLSRGTDEIDEKKIIQEIEQIRKAMGS